jgi:hypothetical protein
LKKGIFLKYGAGFSFREDVPLSLNERRPISEITALSKLAPFVMSFGFCGGDKIVAGFQDHSKIDRLDEKHICPRTEDLTLRMA